MVSLLNKCSLSLSLSIPSGRLECQQKACDEVTLALECQQKACDKVTLALECQQKACDEVTLALECQQKACDKVTLALGHSEYWGARPAWLDTT